MICDFLDTCYQFLMRTQNTCTLKHTHTRVWAHIHTHTGGALPHLVIGRWLGMLPSSWKLVTGVSKSEMCWEFFISASGDISPLEHISKVFQKKPQTGLSSDTKVKDLPGILRQKWQDHHHYDRSCPGWQGCEWKQGDSLAWLCLWWVGETVFT